MSKLTFIIFSILSSYLCAYLPAQDSLQVKLHEQDLKPAPVTFHEFSGYNLILPSGTTAKVIEPAAPAKGNPWIWRARFWGHQPAFDLALLEKGYHLCYCDVTNLYGSPKALIRWDEFYQLSQNIGLHPKPVLEGMSRGGLIIFNWAKANPEKVTAIYADNPVCDIRSWPRKKSKKDWQRCLAAHEITEEQILEFTGNPFDNLEALAKAQVPIFFVLGETDQVVPIKENALIFTKRYQTLGGKVISWLKPNKGHHPHGLEPVDPLVEAILTLSE